MFDLRLHCWTQRSVWDVRIDRRKMLNVGVYVNNRHRAIGGKENIWLAIFNSSQELLLRMFENTLTRFEDCLQAQTRHVWHLLLFNLGRFSTMWNRSKEYSQCFLTIRKNVGCCIELKTCEFEEGLRFQTERCSPAIKDWLGFRLSLKSRLVDWYRCYGATTPSHLGRKLAGPLCTAFSSARQTQRRSTSSDMTALW
jgi:hypothetical protein